MYFKHNRSYLLLIFIWWFFLHFPVFKNVAVFFYILVINVGLKICLLIFSYSFYWHRSCVKILLIHVYKSLYFKFIFPFLWWYVFVNSDSQLKTLFNMNQGLQLYKKYFESNPWQDYLIEWRLFSMHLTYFITHPSKAMYQNC